MLLNHARQTPHQWDDAVPSLCPDCRAPLTARRGRVLVWHWAHRPATTGGGGGGCTATETQWHLLWKAVYHDFPGWEVEAPFRVNGQQYRVDAANRRTGKLREFVHSLSETYILKHLALRRSGHDVLWIFDGRQFSARRAYPIRNGGIRHLLKPKARWLHSHVGGLVHLDGRLWRHWKMDRWYPIETGAPARLVASFEQKWGQLACVKAKTQGAP